MGDAGHDVRVYIDKAPPEAQVKALCNALLSRLGDKEFWSSRKVPLLDRKPVVRVDRLDSCHSWGERIALILEDIDRLHEALQKPALLLCPGQAAVLPSGFAVALPLLPPPLAAVMKIVGRSGWAGKDRLCVANAPGIVDASYRDEVFIALENRSEATQIITHESRVGQALFELCLSLDPTEHQVESLEQLGRGGFGSSGTD